MVFAHSYRESWNTVSERSQADDREYPLQERLQWEGQLADISILKFQSPQVCFS